MTTRHCFYLNGCSTCARILEEVQAEKHSIVLQDIKTQPMTAEQVDDMAKAAGSYEALFSKRAMKYRGMGLHEQTLSESDLRGHIIAEYTFLKRPVFWIDGELFVGNSKKVVAAVMVKLGVG